MLKVGPRPDVHVHTRYDAAVHARPGQAVRDVLVPDSVLRGSPALRPRFRPMSMAEGRVVARVLHQPAAFTVLVFWEWPCPKPGLSLQHRKERHSISDERRRNTHKRKAVKDMSMALRTCLCRYRRVISEPGWALPIWSIMSADPQLTWMSCSTTSASESRSKMSAVYTISCTPASFTPPL